MKLLIKRLFLNVIVLLVLTSRFELYAVDYQPLSTQVGVATLTDWSNRCFKELVEHSVRGKKSSTFLAAEEFQQCVASFIEQSKNRLSDSADLWLGDKREPAGLYDINVPFYQPVDEKAYITQNKKHAFVQKLVVPSQSKVCFIGDLHGSVHSLLRNVWRLVALGWIGDDFKLVNRDCYMIFNGDFVDRGAYGVECVYTLLRLKLANWDRVFLLRGNHEDLNQSNHDGFYGEVKLKYAGQCGDIWLKLISRFYDLLPFALYLGSGKDASNGNKPNFVQCCHGGIETGYDPAQLLNDATGKVFERIPNDVTRRGKNYALLENDGKSACLYGKKVNNYDGFNWSDFCQSYKLLNEADQGRREYGAIVRVKDVQSLLPDGCDKNDLLGHVQDDALIANLGRAGGVYYFGRNNNEAGFNYIGYLASVHAAQKYLNATKLKAFFRGHQDRCFGLKMFFKSTIEYEGAKGTIGRDYGDYKSGPYHWKYVVPSDKFNQFLIKEYAPIFTFTSAAEGQQVPYDCFGILETADDYEHWNLMPYEVPLSGYFGKEARKNRQGDNHTKLLLNGSDVIAYFFNPSKTYKIDASNVALASSLAGVDEALSHKAINNQILRVQEELIATLQKKLLDARDKEKNTLNIKLIELKNALQALKSKLADLHTKLGDMRSALQAK